MDMEDMIAFWVELEVVEKTPVVDQVATRRRGSSSKFNNLLNIFGGSLKRNSIEDSNENENISILTEDSREGSKSKTKMKIIPHSQSRGICGRK